MRNTTQTHDRRIFTVAVLLSSALAMLPAIWGVVLLHGSLLPTAYLLIVSFVVPGLWLLWNLFLCLSKLRNVARICCTLAPILPVFLLLLASVPAGHFRSLDTWHGQDAITEYGYAERTTPVLPAPEELSDAADAVFYDYCEERPGSTVFSRVLICQYDSDTYAVKKQALAENYVYSGEPVILDGFTFRFFSTEEASYHLVLGKDMVIAATNDSTRQILFLDVWSYPASDISSGTDFLQNDCGWKYMSKTAK